jgi:hypothetical protein
LGQGARHFPANGLKISGPPKWAAVLSFRRVCLDPEARGPRVDRQPRATAPSSPTAPSHRHPRYQRGLMRAEPTIVVQKKNPDARKGAAGVAKEYFSNGQSIEFSGFTQA